MKRALVDATGGFAPRPAGAAGRVPTPHRFASLIALLVSATAAADPVAVKVIDVAGGSAYLSPGRAAGIVPGTVIRLRGVEATVVEVTERTCVVRLDGARVAVGDAGTADVTPGAALAVKRLDPPRPAEAFVGQWRDPAPPATRQTPRRVPLDAGRAPRPGKLAVIGHAFGVVDGAGSTGSAEARVIATYDLVPGRPLAADLDVAARWFADGFDPRTRTPLLVRAAVVRYGARDDARLAAGRLPFAAAWLGMLDGIRASARLGALEVAGFGGLVPDPLSGKPDTGAARFGAELAYDAPTAAWQPRVSLAAHGSTWSGDLDERRLTLAGSAGRGALWLDGWAEAQQFAADNPWGARGVELTGAGATAEWRRRGVHAGVDLTFLRPERSLRLAAALPPEWLCTLTPQPGDACATGDWWAAATASLGWRTARWALDGVATLASTHREAREARGIERSGYVRGELAGDPVRWFAGLGGGTASFASWTSVELGAAYAPRHDLDLAVAYRPEILDYAASTERQVLHSLLTDARLAVWAALDLALSATGTFGADRDALTLLATFVWRPRP
jgi:hypothetical protein